MARYIDKDHWEEEILIPNTNTAILGGQPVWEGDRLVDGFANIPPAILADRTRHLKNRIDNIEADIDADFSSFIRKEDNLSDLEDIQQAKYNLGLNLVDNTRDLDKPVSVPQQEALDTKVDKEAGKGLSENDFTDAEKNKLAGIETGAQVNSVISVAGRVGAVELSKSDIAGLENVDNTSDLNKPISTATQTALNSKVDKEAGKQLSTEDFTSAEKTKLAGIAIAATANQTDAFLLNRANHTGSQPISSITNLQTSLDSKVDKEAGMGLSQENYTTAEKNKLASLESSRFKGEFVSLSALEAAFPTTEVGSFAYVDQGVGEDVVKYIWDSSDQRWVLQQGESATLTPSDVKSLYESNPDTNAFTDSEKSKLAGIANGATANTGTVTSVGISVPTGLTVSGSPITSSGTFGITFTTGYSIPTNAKQTQWDTAYGWGNHASAGYATTSDLTTGLSGKLDVGATAASANQLATARTINGTSFNGTANITTSNWGTARTLTVGETGKSVNGSSNVTWSLTEIGAAPTVHTHTASQISDSTAVGRSVLTAADVATARAAIGAGTSNLTIGITAGTAKEGNWLPTSATKTNVLQGSSSSVFVTPSSYFSVISWATGTHSTGTVTLNLDTSLNHNLSVGGNITMASPSNADAGKTGDIVITMTANGTVSWDTNWKFLGSVPDIGASGEVWVISYKVLDSSFIIAAASKVAS